MSLNIAENEILAIVGDNGAGKSTLMNILAGIHRQTSGTVKFRGETVTFSDPSDARTLGIETVYQDLALMDDLDVAANVFMGRFPTRFTVGPFDIIDWPRTYEQADDILQRLGQDLDVRSEVEFLSGGQRQLVAVARSLLFDPEIIIFDEPTSALSIAGTELVHDTMHQLRDEGHTQVVISHNVADVIELADRIAVMYQGQLVDVVDPSTVDRDDLATMMRTGHS
ncbi:ATP-binding cassette domain-containing protein [Halorubrum sp. Ib24]|uniref:ATP-binding cassette domain-containing protein n=1 Tax=Halorubrum sp. Ib24 TaxID=1383850 RepID=UPI001302F662|nr:ATP-binding cassette domain-containing protein [Halorubrum sp. Ib24]